MHLQKRSGTLVIMMSSFLFLFACGRANDTGEVRTWHPEEVQDMSIVRNAMIPESDQKKTDEALSLLFEAAEQRDIVSSRELFSEHLLSGMLAGKGGITLDGQQFASEYFMQMRKVADLSLNDFQVKRFGNRIEYQYLNDLSGSQRLVVFQFIEEGTDWKLENYYISK